MEVRVVDDLVGEIRTKRDAREGQAAPDRTRVTARVFVRFEVEDDAPLAVLGLLRDGLGVLSALLNQSTVVRRTYGMTMLAQPLSESVEEKVRSGRPFA